MKKYIISGLIILNSILTHFCFAQFNDKPIRLSPEIGDTLDLSERNYYNLFPEVKDFQYAVIYLNSDSNAVTKIICRNDEGLVRDIAITNSADYVGNLKTYIRQINLDRLENYGSDDIITVTKLDGNQLMGKLLAVQDSSFIICPDTISEVGTLTFLKTYKKLNANEVESIFFELGYWSDVGTGVAAGSFLGALSGAIIGCFKPVGSGWLDEFERMENALIGSAIGLALGASVGFATGLILATPDETIEINSASDLERLKEYVVQ